MAAAKAAGAGYAIFTATHFNGFMQWQSDLYPYGLKQTKWRDGSAAGRKFLNTGGPDGTEWSPGMVNVPLRGANKVHNWFWSPDQNHSIESTETLVRMYDQSVGRNCNFVIGAAIQPDGTLPEADARRLAEFGAEIKRRFGRLVAETKGEGETVELQLPATYFL